jgi:UDP-N-acetylmuramoyl-L-alanyl-D-glutamate--2,6-diaminopimelate ligase
LVVTRFALDEPSADITARSIELRPDGTSFDLMTCGGRPVPVRTALVGSFNVMNALAAATTALLGGFDLDAIVAGLEQMPLVPGRMERIDAGQDFTVLVDYAHTPDALAAALTASRGLVGSGGRVIAVFGCGGDRDRAKRPLMGAIAAGAADHAFLTTDNPRSEDPSAIVADVLAGVPAGAAIERIDDRRSAIHAAIDAARPGDVVLIAGKGHEQGQTAGGRTEPFDDRLVVRADLEARA